MSAPGVCSQALNIVVIIWKQISQDSCPQFHLIVNNFCFASMQDAKNFNFFNFQVLQINVLTISPFQTSFLISTLWNTTHFLKKLINQHQIDQKRKSQECIFTSYFSFLQPADAANTVASISKHFARGVEYISQT